VFVVLRDLARIQPTPVGRGAILYGFVNSVKAPCDAPRLRSGTGLNVRHAAWRHPFDRRSSLMIATRDRARQAAPSFHQARARRDLSCALDHVADDVVVEGPDGRAEGILAFADRLGAELQALERTDLVAVFGDDATALLIHDDQTLTAAGRAATHVTVEEGRIVRFSRSG
jgi:hypothetical protein